VSEVQPEVGEETRLSLSQLTPASLPFKLALLKQATVLQIRPCLLSKVSIDYGKH
jgi:hypothetical protein